MLGALEQQESSQSDQLGGGLPSWPWSLQGSDPLPTLVLQMMAAAAPS